MSARVVRVALLARIGESSSTKAISKKPKKWITFQQTGVVLCVKNFQTYLYIYIFIKKKSVCSVMMPLTRMELILLLNDRKMVPKMHSL